jgi:hypothetical protein
MLGRIHFQYRCLHDVVLAYVDWHLETMEDLEIWAGQYETYFHGRFTDKVDLVLELSKFRLSPRLAPRFRELRNGILTKYVNLSYRVNEPAMERAMMYAGSVLNGGPANAFDSIDEAIAALLRDRAERAPADGHSTTRLSAASEHPPLRVTKSSPPRAMTR